MQYAGMDPGREVGGAAPHFSLPNQFGEPVSLLELHGTAVALVFYPFAFSGVCTRELNELQENSGMFANAGVHLLAVLTFLPIFGRTGKWQPAMASLIRYGVWPGAAHS